MQLEIDYVMREVKKALRALSDETRLRILSLLLIRECCVCEVMQVLDISQSRASRNLNILYDAGFLQVRRDGLWSYYSVSKKQLKEFPSLLVKAVQLGLVKNKTISADRARLKDTKRLGTCCSSV